MSDGMSVKDELGRREALKVGVGAVGTLGALGGMSGVAAAQEGGNTGTDVRVQVLDDAGNVVESPDNWEFALVDVWGDVYRSSVANTGETVYTDLVGIMEYEVHVYDVAAGGWIEPTVFEVAEPEYEDRTEIVHEVRPVQDDLAYDYSEPFARPYYDHSNEASPRPWEEYASMEEYTGGSDSSSSSPSEFTWEGWDYSSDGGVVENDETDDRSWWSGAGDAASASTESQGAAVVVSMLGIGGIFVWVLLTQGREEAKELVEEQVEEQKSIWGRNKED